MSLSRAHRWPWEAIALLIIILLAFALRFYRLDAQSFWNDEGTSVALAQRDLATITRNAAHDIHPPLYYYSLRGWMLVFGRSAPLGAELAARSLSAFTGLLLVMGTYALARRLWGTGVALLAALFSCLSPFQVYYSQEARMYVGVALFGLLSTLALERLLRHWKEVGRAGSFLWAVLYVLSITAALYTQYYALSLLLAQNIIFLVWLAIRWRHPTGEWRRPLLHWVLVQIVVILAFVPWLWLARGSLRSWPAVSASLSWSALLADVARVYALGITVAEDSRHWLWGLALALPLVPALLADLRAWKRRGIETVATAPASGVCGQETVAMREVGAIPLSHSPRIERGIDMDDATSRAAAADGAGGGAILVWIYLLVPIIVMYVLSLQRPMYKPKFLLLATPPFYMLQGRGLMAIGQWLARTLHRRWLALGLWGALTLLIFVGPVASLRRLYYDPDYARDDYRGIVTHIEAHAGPDDAILVNAPTQIETVGYYYRGPLKLYPLPLQRPIDVDRTQAALEEIVSQHPRIYGIFWATDESDPQRYIETWLDSRSYKAMDSWYGNVRLVVYAVPLATAASIEQPTEFDLGEAIRLRGYTLLTPQPRSGDILQLTLFWEAERPISARYKVFCHLVDGAGNIVGQRDSEPGGGLNLTSDWPAGQLIPDNYGLLIPPDTPPGEHILRVGMYGLDDGLRLPVSLGGKNVGDSIDLDVINIGG